MKDLVHFKMILRKVSDSMSQKKRIILMPSYMKSFRCVGSKCEDSCCIGFKVDLDKETYLKYNKIQNKEIKSIVTKSVTRKHNDKSEISYGNIHMDDDKRCPFLNEKNLCKVYINLGEEYLSNTCTVYPRYLNKVDGKLERSATMSCPEAARLAILNKDGIMFEQVEEEEDLKIVINNRFDTEGHLFLNKPQRYFWEIRIFSLSILQNRNYTLSERLVILGVFYENIENLYKNDLTNEIPNVIEKMSYMVEEKSLREELNSLPTNMELQMLLIKEIIDNRETGVVVSGRYVQCLKETLLGIGYIEGEQQEKILEKYNINREKYLLPYLEEKEYLLENYLVNEHFRELMPFGNFKAIWDSYIYLCVLYSMVKFHMIGMSGAHKGLTDELTIKLIQSLSKVFTHSTKYIAEIIRLLKDNNYDSLAYMSILVKN